MAQPNPGAHALLQQAMIARQQRRREDEWRLLDEAVTRFPDDARAHNAFGMHALSAGDAAGAIASFTRAAALDPREPALRLNLASAYRTLSDVAGEQRALEAALEIDQLFFMARLRLAELFEREAMPVSAAQQWSAVVQIAEGAAERPPGVLDAIARGRRFLAEHGRALEHSVVDQLGDGWMTDPADRRFRVCLEHMFGRRRIYRNECAGLHYPFLPADEFFERDHFPWFDEIEAKASAIRGEALALLESGGDAIRPYVRMDKGTPENKWTALDHSLAWGACFLWEFGEKNEEVCRRCPETANALAALPQTNIPGKAPSAFFSILRPGAHIPPHTGVTNTRAIVHLPLVVPDGCLFRVGGETRPWRESEAFAFDDTIEHEAWNRSEHVRIVLIFDVWNPHLTEVERAQLVKLFAVFERDVVAVRA